MTVILKEGLELAFILSLISVIMAVRSNLSGLDADDFVTFKLISKTNSNN